MVDSRRAAGGDATSTTEDDRRLLTLVGGASAPVRGVPVHAVPTVSGAPRNRYLQRFH